MPSLGGFTSEKNLGVNLGNLMDVQEQDINNCKFPVSGVQGRSFLERPFEFMEKHTKVKQNYRTKLTCDTCYNSLLVQSDLNLRTCYNCPFLLDRLVQSWAPLFKEVVPIPERTYVPILNILALWKQAQRYEVCPKSIKPPTSRRPRRNRPAPTGYWRGGANLLLPILGIEYDLVTQRFKNGHISVESDDRSGRPSTARAETLKMLNMFVQQLMKTVD
ncbi:hypothetical protein J6590_037145 [Homalodisca vitripennis]|nr:hypothetical protein J6590_037145 [Homalodisca vitripennis]